MKFEDYAALKGMSVDDDIVRVIGQFPEEDQGRGGLASVVCLAWLGLARTNKTVEEMGKAIVRYMYAMGNTVLEAEGFKVYCEGCTPRDPPTELCRDLKASAARVAESYKKMRWPE